MNWIGDLSPSMWVLLFGVASLLFFASYLISGVTRWGWLFPATITGGVAAVIWLSERGFSDVYLGSLMVACVSLPFWVAFLVNRQENWWALIPGWITAAVAAQCTSVALADFSGKGRPDLLVGVLRGPNRLFRNAGNGTFTDVTDEIGLGQRIFNSRSVALVDLNRDGAPDVVFGNDGQESNVLLSDPAKQRQASTR